MRQGLQLLIVLVVVLVGGVVGYSLIFSEDERPSLRLVEASGTVLRTGPGGQVQPLGVGDELVARDGVQVGEGSTAVLGLGDETRLELHSASSMRVVDVDASGVRVELESGRVSARVRPGGGQVGVSSRGRAVYGSDADFTVAVEDDGLFVTQAERGSLRTEGMEGLPETVSAGMLLSALPGRDAVLGAVPEALKLVVSWPDPLRVRLPQLVLEGQTGPYVQVSVGDGEQWTRIRSGSEGSFRVPLELDLGANGVVVQVRDALGNQREDERVIERERTAPSILGSEVQWGR